MSRTWDDINPQPSNGPRERAPETLSQALYGGESWRQPDFCGPGRYLGPRTTRPAYVRDPASHPGSAAVDAALRGDQPVITYQGTHDGDVGEVPWEHHPPRQPGLEVHRDHGGGAQVLVAGAYGDRNVVDLLGVEHFVDGQSDPPLGPMCEWCHKPMSAGPRGVPKRFCSSVCRRKAWVQKHAQ